MNWEWQDRAMAKKKKKNIHMHTTTTTTENENKQKRFWCPRLTNPVSVLLFQYAIRVQYTQLDSSLQI